MSRLLYTAFDVVPAPKGASTHIVQFVRGLVNAGFDVDVLTPGDGILPERGVIEGASITRIAGEPGSTYLSRAMAFRDAVRTHLRTAPPYDAVHYRSIWGGLEAGQLRRERGFRTVFEVNGLPSIELKYHYPMLADSELLLKMREQELATLALSDLVVCVSRVSREYLMSLGTPEERIVVIPNGVSETDFEAVTPRRPSAPEDRTALYLGTLAPWQGLDLLLEAWAHLAEATEVPPRLRIVGRGRSRQRKLLAKRIRKLRLDHLVTVEAPVPHHGVPRLLQEVDACVAPLVANDRNVTQGCCPIKVLEYMASGRPLVASNLPVVRELVREDVEALLFAPGDATDLARQLLRVLSDPELASGLAERARTRVLNDFSWRTARRALVEAYSDRLGVRPSSELSGATSP